MLNLKIVIDYIRKNGKEEGVGIAMTRVYESKILIFHRNNNEGKSKTYYILGTLLSVSYLLTYFLI